MTGSLGRVFDHVAIAVSDLAASERFYRTVIPLAAHVSNPAVTISDASARRSGRAAWQAPEAHAAGVPIAARPSIFAPCAALASSCAASRR
jgi:catechol 2,3-dioxygenase-like lactoylglutathione lyase family enzyme